MSEPSVHGMSVFGCCRRLVEEMLAITTHQFAKLQVGTVWQYFIGVC